MLGTLKYPSNITISTSVTTNLRPPRRLGQHAMASPPAPTPPARDAAPAPAPAPAPSFAFPREYHFPAFFTRQPNLATHHAQLSKWSALVLAYARHHRLFRLRLSAAADSDLFRNRRIDRRLAPADIRRLVDFMRRDGRVEYLDPRDPAADVVLVHWRMPDEWAALVEAYIDASAHKGSVLTLYELTEGEATRGTGRCHVPPPLPLRGPVADADGRHARAARHRWSGASQGAQHPGEAGQGPDFRPRRFPRRQILLVDFVRLRLPCLRTSFNHIGSDCPHGARASQRLANR